MSRPDVAERAAELRRARSPFVHARVVLAERPTSAKPGDEALVLPDGTIEGFVGGTCAETTVRVQSLALLDSGESLLLRITPVPETAQPGKVTVVNECLSGGTFEVFLEPVMPAPLVTVVGDTPIARALHRIGSAVGYEMATYDPALHAAGSAASQTPSAVVVASHGRDEESALAQALASQVPYVGLVASRRRGAAVLAGLDVPAADRDRVHTPAGLDLGARSAEEVALSILAEIVATRPAPPGAGGAREPDEHHDHGAEHGDEHPGHAHPEAGPGTAIDPVCGMTVATVEASLHLDVDGTRYWFCGTGCLRAFADDPDSYRRV